MIFENALLTEQCKILSAVGPQVIGAGTKQYVSLKDYRRLAIIINVLNAGSAVTGMPVSLKQAQDVEGTAVKALPFTNVFANLDAAAGDTLAAQAVANNTFTTDATVSKNLVYVIEVTEDMLDAANGFDSVAVAIGAGAAAATAGITYVLWGARYGKPTPPSAVVD